MGGIRTSRAEPGEAFSPAHESRPPTADFERLTPDGRWPAWKIGAFGLLYASCLGVLLLIVAVVLGSVTHIDLL